MFNKIVYLDDDLHYVSRLTRSIISSYRTFFQQSSDWNSVLPLTHSLNTKEFKLKRSVSLHHFSEFVQSRFSTYRIRCSKETVSVWDDSELIVRVVVGNGCRTRAAGGISGKTFESELYEDIKQKRINPLTKCLSDVLSNYSIGLFDSEPILVANRNSKRVLKFIDSQFQMDSTGSTISDIDIKSHTRIVHLSLKNSSRYYLCNMSLRKYFSGDVFGENVERDEMLQYLGFSPKEFLKPYGIHSSTSTSLSHPTIINNWETLLTQVIGSGYIHVEGGSQPVVKDYHITPEISVDKFFEPVYSHPGVRKYSKVNLLVNIGSEKKLVECQLRGTESTDIYPYYMRICVR